ncbi:MAG TPA: isocitrate lyase/phosphoenolpyruvate mutase family protein, partial [Terriglobia bacterium]|nr:isocitrate lyase/phosphoenolpyruvate mutase family protein [Terriglobia bacterium]
VEEAGFPAAATTSAGIANSLGYSDGQRIGRDEMLRVVERIAAAVSIPVTADMEAGYGMTPKEVAETARAVIGAGAVGMNFEDGTGRPNQPLEDLSLQIEKICAIREAAVSSGVPLVLNARTDVYLRAVGDPAGRLEHSILRANAYSEAGADCLFVPGARDEEVIRHLVRGIRGPLNVLAGPGTPGVRDLERIGVARVSMGSGPMRATLALVRRIARELLENGAYTAFTDDAIPYEEANRLFENRAP